MPGPAIEGTDRGCSYTGVMVKASRARRPDGFDLVRATLNNFNHDGGLFDQPQYSTTGTAGKRLVRVCLGTVNNG